MAKQKLILNADTIVPGLQSPCALKESAARCTRCNACVQSCPAYLQQPQEAFSPRGRAQLIKLLSNQKLKTDLSQELLTQIVHSCVLCARCSRTCAGQIPIAHHMLALRKALGLHTLPYGLYILLYLQGAAPKLFDTTLRTLLFLHRIKLGFLCYPLLPKKTGSLQRLLRKNNLPISSDKPKALYLPSLYAQYIDPQAGLLAVEGLSAKKPTVLFNIDCGLFDYLYGSRTRCLQLAKHLLTTWEKYAGKHLLPFFTDSIEIYSFLKNYPMLFQALPAWKERAEKFAKQVQFIVDMPFPVKKKNAPQKAALETSSVLFPVTDVLERARKILLTTYGKNLLEFEYSRFPLPAASVGFVYPSEADSLVLRQVKDLTRQQIQRVYCLSAWAALELNAVLRKCDPLAQARFIIYIRTDYGRI